MDRPEKFFRMGREGGVTSAGARSGGAGKELSTVVVAAVDSHASGKASANYVCDGVADQETINEAIATVCDLGSGSSDFNEIIFTVSGATDSYYTRSNHLAYDSSVDAFWCHTQTSFGQLRFIRYDVATSTTSTVTPGNPEAISQPTVRSMKMSRTGGFMWVFLQGSNYGKIWRYFHLTNTWDAGGVWYDVNAKWNFATVWDFGLDASDVLWIAGISLPYSARPHEMWKITARNTTSATAVFTMVEDVTAHHGPEGVDVDAAGRIVTSWPLQKRVRVYSTTGTLYADTVTTYLTLGASRSPTGAVLIHTRDTSNTTAGLAEMVSTIGRPPSTETVTFNAEVPLGMVERTPGDYWGFTYTSGLYRLWHHQSATPGGGGRVILLEGTYTLTGQIDIDCDDITLRGQGPSTILNSVAPETAIVAFNRCSIQDLAIVRDDWDAAGMFLIGEGSVASGVSVTGCDYGIYLAAASIRVDGCHFTECSNSVVADLAPKAAILNSVFKRCFYGPFVQTNSNDSTVVGNQISNPILGGIEVVGSSRVTVSGNVVFGVGALMEIDNTDYSTEENVGIRVTMSAINAFANVVSGNVVTQTYVGIAIEDARNTVNYNVIDSCLQHGIKLIDSFAPSLGATDCTVRGNMVYGSGSAAANTYDGIHISPTIVAASRNNIQANVVRETSHRYGIRVNSALAVDNLITNNDVRGGYTSGGISDAGTGTITAAGNRL